jgi:hypothetical protein
MTKEYLDNLEKDLQLIIRDNFHPKHTELMNIAIKEEVIELIKWAKTQVEIDEWKFPVVG